MRFTTSVFLALASLVSTTLAADSLDSGFYYISNSDKGAVVGRAFIEDRSFNPKRIVVNSNAEPWNVTSLGDDKYILRHRGAPAASINGAIYADLLPQDIEQWVIQLQVAHNAYTIVSSTNSEGWILRDSAEGTQVSSSFLASTFSIPPQFPPFELWNFHPEA